jgi:hypothetical protein
VMGKRHDAIGIKQAIRYEWMQKTTNLLLAGLDAKVVRRELHEFLSERKYNGFDGKCSSQTRTFVVNNLMRIWVSPDHELVNFRDRALELLCEHPSMALSIHWAMISTMYPFWFNVARQVGRLLNLQDQVTQTQIINRIREQYGDRSTVSRYARFVIRSFVAWGVLKDSKAKGCYEKAMPIIISDQNLAILLFESALNAIPEGKEVFGALLNNPAFFPFQIPMITGDFVARQRGGIDVVRHGLDDELLKLKEK